jgi:hypothetical protein
MIMVKSVYIGNDTESYIQHGFRNGLNIVSSTENHVGKTIVLQSIMYALGADPKFPSSFRFRDYLFVLDIDVDGREVSILRNKNYFVVREGKLITPLETKSQFDEFWSNNVFMLPRIIKNKNGSVIWAGLSLYTQMSFIPQTGRNTANITNRGYFDKNDFIEMLYSIKEMSARALDTRAEQELKRRKAELKTRKAELEKQAAALRKVGSSLYASSSTADREETAKFLAKLDDLKNQISDCQKRRNHAYTRMKKNQQVLEELRSLDREIKVGSIVCMNCGSEAIGYKIPGSSFAFDLTTTEMRQQIMSSVNERVERYSAEAEQLNREIRGLQRKFDLIANERKITLEDIFSARDGLENLSELDAELSTVCDEIDSIEKSLKEAKQVDKNLSKSRAEFKERLVDSMNRVRHAINDDEYAEEYSDLFTTSANPYIGSEETEFLLARVYALAKHIQHKLPVIVDSFRAEELSTSREERALPLFEELPNQVIFSATLKGQESEKYKNRIGVNNIDYAGYTAGKLLSESDNEEFNAKVASFGIFLN